MGDSFKNLGDSPEFSARRLAAVTPHDTNELAFVSKALFIATGGNISIIAVDDTDAVVMKVFDNTLLPVRARIVKSAGTTASGIVALA